MLATSAAQAMKLNLNQACLRLGAVNHHAERLTLIYARRMPRIPVARRHTICWLLALPTGPAGGLSWLRDAAKLLREIRR